MSAATILTSVFAHGGRATRYGEYTVIHMHNCSFITTPMESMQMQNWARGKVSSGNPGRDRTTFVERFETVLARVGSGLTTRGNRSILGRIVKAMTANATMIQEWSVPHDLGQSMEIRKPVRPVAVVPPLPK
jgi:hypothetical protein